MWLAGFRVLARIPWVVNSRGTEHVGVCAGPGYSHSWNTIRGARGQAAVRPGPADNSRPAATATTVHHHVHGKLAAPRPGS
jgi:hypothetical protein